MIKKRYYSIHNDFKTGLFSKLFIIIGIFLLFLYLINFVIIFLNEEIRGIIIAFSIIFIGFGIILMLFSYLFNKLDKISEEIENIQDEEN